MEKLALIVALGIVTSSFLCLNTALAGQITDRQINQQKKIHQGVVSGSLTPGEATVLEREQRRIRRYKQEIWSDGVLTPGEKARMHYQQDKANAHIYRKKHNDIQQ
ncbi:MAG: hypothetical protein SWE60_26430 [Thermodesulfobacteriota bacterium]|nr:hypothetical protein [Thermodesulfobacteriota bacterium]